SPELFGWNGLDPSPTPGAESRAWHTTQLTPSAMTRFREPVASGSVDPDVPGNGRVSEPVIVAPMGPWQFTQSWPSAWPSRRFSCTASAVWATMIGPVTPWLITDVRHRRTTPVWPPARESDARKLTDRPATACPPPTAN